MNIIINLRGTSGSGKSTAARYFIDKYLAHEDRDEQGKILGYWCELPHLNSPLYVVGRYTSQCGGLDTVSTQQECVDRVMNAYRAGGNVLAEGLLLTGTAEGGTFIRQVGAVAQRSLVIANLDTPLEVCIERVKQRRLNAGNTKELNEENTRAKYKQMWSADEKLRAAGYNVVNIDHRDVNNQLQQLFFEADPHPDHV